MNLIKGAAFLLQLQSSCDTLPTLHIRGNLNELCYFPQPHLHGNYWAQWAAVIFAFYSRLITNSRDGTARGGLASLWRRWFLFLSILTHISALEGETSPLTEPRFVRALPSNRNSVWGTAGAQRTRRQFGNGSDTCYGFLDYGDVVVLRRVNYGCFPRFNRAELQTRSTQNALESARSRDFACKYLLGVCCDAFVVLVCSRSVCSELAQPTGSTSAIIIVSIAVIGMIKVQRAAVASFNAAKCCKCKYKWEMVNKLSLWVDVDRANRSSYYPQITKRRRGCLKSHVPRSNN